MESGVHMAHPQPLWGETVQGRLTVQKDCKTIGTMAEANELVREFPKKELAPECKNLVIGSSKIGTLAIDKSIPIDAQSMLSEGPLPTRKLNFRANLTQKYSIFSD